MRNFLAVSEKGRKRGKISFYIAEIMPETGLRLIDNDLTLFAQSNRGFHTEIVLKLVEKNELPKDCIAEDGYINYSKKDGNYNIIFVEGQGLNYVNQFYSNR